MATPCKSGSINKALLTPCRRLGLARKIKTTPTSQPQSPAGVGTPSLSFTPTTSPSVAIIKDSVPLTLLSPSTPINVEKSKKTESKRNSVSAKIKSRNRQIKPETTKSKKCESNQKTECLDFQNDVSTTKQVESKNVKDEFKGFPENSANCKTCKENKNFDMAETNVKMISEQKDTGRVAKQNEIVCNRKQISDNEQVCSAMLLSDNEDVPDSYNMSGKSNTNSNINVKPKKTKLLKRLSMKKSLSLSQDDLSDIDEVLNTPKRSSTSFISEEFTKTCLMNTDENDSDNESIKLFAKTNRKRCIVYSSDEEDFVSQQKTVKVENNSQPKSSSETIEELQKRIKMKEAHLSDLKQAAIYKKLHDVDELNSLSLVWKNGCHNVLRHLLRKLQEHGPMDMSALMKNLQIPSFISYNVESDTFT